MRLRFYQAWWVVLALAGVWLEVACEASQPAALDLAGGSSRQTARYTLDDAIGGWTLDSESGTGTWVKPDFCGSLVDPKALEITSPVTQLGEGQSVQLASRIRCDDGSYWSDGVTAAWAVVSGPLLHTGGGWVNAQPVYRSSNALVSASGAGLTGEASLLVLNTHLDNFGFYATDGVDDDWQVHYFGLDNPDGGRGADPDHDGQDNYYEFTAGTRPDSDSDAFELDLRRLAGAIQVGFGPMTTGRTYRVERVTNLVTEVWAGVTNLQPVAPETMVYLTDTQMVDNLQFYRVQIDHPWRATP